MHCIACQSKLPIICEKEQQQQQQQQQAEEEEMKEIAAQVVWMEPNL